MTVAPDLAARRALASLLGFWAEAGVDATYADAPVDRLAPPERPAAAVAQPALRPPVMPETGPADVGGLDELRAAAAAAPTLAALLEAREDAGALLMAPVAAAQVVWVVAGPDADDVAAGRLLAGARGRLFTRMVRAAGLEGRVAVAAAAPPPARGAGPDVAGAARHGLVLERALQLAAPRMVVAAGDAALRALTGEQASILKSHGRLREWRGAHFGLLLPLMPTFALETLMAQPAAKARAWRDILTLAACVDSATGAP